MDYDFNLPDGWIWRQSPTADGYEFWLEAEPTHRFMLTRTALAVYGDKPEQLVKIIKMQMEMLEASKAARSLTPMPYPSHPPETGKCTTPYYCGWALKNKKDGYHCYCGVWDIKPQRESK